MLHEVICGCGDFRSCLLEGPVALRQAVAVEM